MAKEQENNELWEKINLLERQLSILNQEINNRNSSEIEEIRNLIKESIQANSSFNDQKFSILNEKFDRHLKQYEEDRSIQWKLLRDVDERSKNLEQKNQNDIDHQRKKEEVDNKERLLREKELQIEMHNRIEENYKKQIGIFEKIQENNEKIQEKQKVLSDHFKEYLFKSMRNKVDWNSFVNSADLENIISLVRLYESIKIPSESHINYPQLKRRLETLREETFIVQEIATINETLTDLNRAYFRKNKSKSRNSFISQEAKKVISNDKNKIENNENKAPMKIFSTRMNQTYIDRLQKIADRTGNNRNELIRDAVEKALERWEDLTDEDLAN